MLGGGAGGFRRGRGIGDPQYVREVDQYASQRPSSPVWVGEPGGFAEIGDRLGAPSGPAQAYPAEMQQFDDLAGVNIEGLTEGECLGGEAVGVR